MWFYCVYCCWIFWVFYGLFVVVCLAFWFVVNLCLFVCYLGFFFFFFFLSCCSCSCNIVRFPPQIFKTISEENVGKVKVFFCGSPFVATQMKELCDKYDFDFCKEIF